MFVDIIDNVITTTLGEQVEEVSMGLLLNVNGQEQGIPVRELTDIYLDNEDISQATKLYVTYQDQEYEFKVPEQDTADWQYLEHLIELE